MIFLGLLSMQLVTFVGLGVYFLVERGDWRLGVAQLLLCAVQGVIYSGRMA